MNTRTYSIGIILAFLYGFMASILHTTPAAASAIAIPPTLKIRSASSVSSKNTRATMIRRKASSQSSKAKAPVSTRIGKKGGSASSKSLAPLYPNATSELLILKNSLGSYFAVITSGSSFERGGFLPGDYIVTVDGVDADRESPESLTALLMSGKQITYGLSSQKHGLRTVTFRYEAPSPSSSAPMEAVTFDGTTAIVRITTFTKGVVDSVEASLRGKTSSIKGIIIDLRSGPAGDFSALARFLELILPKGTTYGSLQNNKVTSTLIARATPVLTPSTRIVLLLRLGSGSASSIIANVLVSLLDADVVIEAALPGTTDITIPAIKNDVRLSNGEFGFYKFIDPSDFHNKFFPRDPLLVERKSSEDTPLREAMKLLGK